MAVEIFDQSDLVFKYKEGVYTVDPNGRRMHSFSADQLALATDSPAMDLGWIGENIVSVLPEPFIAIPPGFNPLQMVSTHAEA